MTKLTLVKPVVKEASKTADPKTVTCFTTIETWANGELDSTNLKTEGIEESSLAAAVKEKLNAKVAGLTLTSHGVSFTAVSGEFATLTAGSLVATLPAAAVANQSIAIVSLSGTSEVVTKGEKIYGDYTNATNLHLAVFNHVLLQSDGTNWAILAGEAKREGTYVTESQTKAKAEAGITPSASRPSFVVLVPGETSATGKVEVGGKLIQEETKTTAPISIWVQPGEVWKAKVSMTNVATLAL